jgi:hypothetical protein
MAGQEYKQRAEYKQSWPIRIGILTETSQNLQKQALKICLKSACIPSFSLGRPHLNQLENQVLQPGFQVEVGALRA